MTWHDLLPWNVIKTWYALGRKRWFSRPRPEGTYYRVGGTFLAEGSDEAVRLNVNRLERRLGSARSFAPNWETSYYKRGEVLNLARVEYDQNTEFDDIQWWQTHVRGWSVASQPGSLDLLAHWEPEPTEHPGAHLEGVGYNRPYGMDVLAEALHEADIEFREVKWTRD